MRLIYNDKYSVIDSNMSDSNVGARNGKNIRNHIFVINGIIHDVLFSKKKKSIDIQIRSVSTQCGWRKPLMTYMKQKSRMIF